MPRKQNARTNWLPLIIFGLVLAGLLSQVFLASPKSKAHSATTQTAAAKPKPAAVDQTALATRINSIINGTNLEVGVSITDLTSGTSYDYGLSTTPYIAASTSKLLSASLFLHDLEQGTYSLSGPLGDSTAQDQLQKMIVNSDNDAWAAFNDLLGHPALSQYAQSIGLTNYDPDQNTITSSDLAILLTKLYQGQLLNAAHTKLLLSYMKSANETEYIAAAIPSGTQFYHKAGYLDDRAMDAAIIDNGTHPYVLVIFTKDPSGSYDQTAGQQVFHSLTTATLSAFR